MSIGSSARRRQIAAREGLTEEAILVNCDRSTMTRNDIENGRLMFPVGAAPVRPAEFVTFRITQRSAGSQQGVPSRGMVQLI